MNFTVTKHTLRRGLAAVSANLASRVKNLPSAMLMIVAIIYLLPLSGVLGSDTVALLYGENFSNAVASIVAFLIFCALTPSWRAPAYGGALAVGLSILYMDGYNTLVARIYVADLFALGCMAIGGIAQVLAYRRS